MIQLYVFTGLYQLAFVFEGRLNVFEGRDS
jgi:hypothetical protein